MSSCSSWSPSALTVTSGPGRTDDRHPRLESGDALQQRLEHDRRQPRRRQPRQLRVGGREAAERVGARADDLQAAPEIVGEIDRRRRALQQRVERAGDRLDGAERVAEFVADDADEPLPRLALLLAQRPADVGDDEQLVPLPAEAERRASHVPAAGAARQIERHDAARLAEPGVEAERVGRVAEQLLGGAAEQALARAVHELQASLRIEREDGDVDLLHHRAQQRRRLHGAQPLLVQRLGQGVDLGHHVAERIAGHGAAAANREVVLAQRRHQVGQRLQRRHDVLAQRRQRARRGRRRAAARPSTGPWRSSRPSTAAAASRRAAAPAAVSASSDGVLIEAETAHGADGPAAGRTPAYSL